MVTVYQAATVSAGPDQLVCAIGNIVTLAGSYGGGATGATWSGAGTFTPDNTTMNATYTLTEAEMAAGTATVTLTATGQLEPCGTASATMTITMNAPPVFTGQPVSMTNCAGSPATFTMSATGTGLSYQWQVSQDGGATFADIPDETGTSYTIPAPTVAQSGYQYRVVVDNAACSAITSYPPAVLTVYGLPTITGQPASLTLCVGSPAVFAVTATGTDLIYQWQASADGGVTFTNISDTETNASYTIPATTLDQSGLQYQVIVSGACSPTLTSAPPAVLIVNAPATASAGPNQTIYAGQTTAGLGGSVGGAATGGLWTSPGGGTFAPNATTLNATYTPSPVDISAGAATLTLHATGQLAPCVATAPVVVTILPRNPTTTTLSGVATPQTYGNTVLIATVSPSGASGNVTFTDGATTLAIVPLSGGTAILATNLAVNGGSPHPIRAQFSDPASVWDGSASGISDVVITAREVTLGGSRTYDGTTTITPATGLSLVNNVDDGNLTLTPSSGIVYVASRNAGAQPILSTLVTNGPTSTTVRASIPANAPSYLIATNYSAPTRVRSGTGATATASATSFRVTMPAAPANGNTLVAVIATRGTSANRVTSISQAGATWSRATQAANGSGSTTEIWYAPNVSGAAAALTINQARLRSAAVVMEYSGLTTIASPLDQVSPGATGNSGTPSTGTTPTTTQSSEVWVGGIGLVSSGYTLTPTGTPLFTSRGSAQSANGTADTQCQSLLPGLRCRGDRSCKCRRHDHVVSMVGRDGDLQDVDYLHLLHDQRRRHTGRVRGA